jgi:hypothetical protein
VQVLVVQLADFMNAVHELREIFELGPLVVCSANRHGDLDGLDDGRVHTRSTAFHLFRQHHAADRERGHSDYSIQHYCLLVRRAIVAIDKIRPEPRGAKAPAGQATWENICF